MDYIYTKRNLLKEKENYQYSEYKGKEFLIAYYAQRRSFLDTVCSNNKDLFRETSGNTFAFFKNFSESIDDINICPDNGFALLLKRFEISKEIWDKTDENFRPIEEASCDDLNLYIAFSYCCCIAYKKTKHLSFLNGLIKSNDIITSQIEFNSVDIKMMKHAISEEIKYVQELERD